jgi:hypothetical protein
MISASYRTNNAYSNGRSSPIHRHSRFSSQRNSTSAISNHGPSSLNSNDFIYKGANKHHWAKLQSKIKQRLMAENISYIDDEEKVARRSMPPPPAINISCTTSIPRVTPRQRRETETTETHRRVQEEEGGQVRRISRPLRQGLPEGHCSALLLPSGIHHHRPRAFHPEHHSPTSNVMMHYRVMKERLLSKHGPNSQKDAEETRKKLEGLRTRRPQGMGRIPRCARLTRRSPVQDTSP